MHRLSHSFEYKELDSASSESYRDVIFNARITNRRQEGLPARHSIEGKGLGAGRQTQPLGPPGSALLLTASQGEECRGQLSTSPRCGQLCLPDAAPQAPLFRP